MRRFSQDDDDEFKDELGPFFDADDDDEQENHAIDPNASMEMIQLDLIEMELNQRLLEQSIAYCQKSLWWLFMGEDARQDMIDKTFARFRRLVTLDESPDKE